MISEVSSLEHETRDDSVEDGVEIAEALLASAEGFEVVNSLGDYRIIKANGDSSSFCTVNRGVEKDLAFDLCLCHGEIIYKMFLNYLFINISFYKRRLQVESRYVGGIINLSQSANRTLTLGGSAIDRLIQSYKVILFIENTGVYYQACDFGFR